MTTILLICSVALNILLFVWALVIWNDREEWKKEAERLLFQHYATSVSPSTPVTSTESPTPAPDADDYGSR